MLPSFFQSMALEFGCNTFWWGFNKAEYRNLEGSTHVLAEYGDYNKAISEC